MTIFAIEFAMGSNTYSFVTSEVCEVTIAVVLAKIPFVSKESLRIESTVTMRAFAGCGTTKRTTRREITIFLRSWLIVVGLILQKTSFLPHLLRMLSYFSKNKHLDLSARELILQHVPGSHV